MTGIPSFLKAFIKTFPNTALDGEIPGALGMSAEQVLRAAIVKALFGYSYRQLAFHIVDSGCLRSFCLTGFGKGFKKSALQKNIKLLSGETWEGINRVIIGHARREKIETGLEARIDCTVVESNIHHPTDANLLWDAVRVLTRFLVAAKDLGVAGPGFQDHTRRAKRRMLGILNAKGQKAREALYADLIKVANIVAADAEKALPWVDAHEPQTLAEMTGQVRIFDGLQHYYRERYLFPFFVFPKMAGEEDRSIYSLCRIP